MRRKQMIVLVIWSILTICSLYYGNRVKQFADSMSVKYESGGLSVQEIDRLYHKTERENEIQAEVPYITGWNKTEGSIVTNPSVGSKISVNLITVYGDMWAVIPQKLMHGTYAEKADKEGCVLSSGAADKLFRSSLVTGCKVTLNQKTYLVKGILQSEEDLLLVQAGTEGVFPYLELRYGSNQYAASNTKAFLTNLGLTQYKSFTEGNLYGGIAGVFMGLPFLITFGILLRKYILIWKKNKQNKTGVQRVLRLVGTVTVAALCLYFLMKFSISFSGDYIPSKISDFAFWGKKYREALSDYKSMLPYQMWPKEAIILGNLKGCIITSLESAGTLIFTRITFMKETYRG